MFRNLTPGQGSFLDFPAAPPRMFVGQVPPPRAETLPFPISAKCARRLTLKMLIGVCGTNTNLLFKDGATGWTGVDTSTPLSSGRYSFLSKNDIKIVRYTFWPSILSLFHPTFCGLAPPLLLFKIVKNFVTHK